MTWDLARRAALTATFLFGACSYTPPDDPGTDGPELPIVTFENATSLADEGVQLLDIPLKLSTPSTSSVDYVVTGGNATPVSDFSFIGGGQSSGTITFAGDTANIQVMFQNDGLEEGIETIEITLMNPQGATIGAEDTHVITISPDILPRVKFTNATTSLDEGIAATLDLELDIEPIATVSVDITLAGSATAVLDYGLTERTVTFAPGVKTAQLDYLVENDDRDELNEIIAVDLASPVGLVIDTTAAHTEHTIVDDDATPTVAFVNAANAQDEDVPDADQIVQLSAASNLIVTVQFAAAGNAANDTDLDTDAPGTLTFQPGETMQEVRLTIIDNATDEPLNETAEITLSAPTNATLGTDVIHTLTIVDDDPPPTFTFAAGATTVTEDGADLTLTVTLSAISDLPITIDFAAGAGSTAANPGDFTFDPTPTTLTFAPGVLTQDITIAFADNAVGEIDETIVLELLNPSNATPGATTTHTITITDDDCFGTGNFRVCPAAAPAANLNLQNGFDTDNNAACVDPLPVGWTTTFGQPDACIVIRNNITIQANGIQLTGSRPLVLLGATSVTLTGVIDASANGITNGSGGPFASCGTPTAVDSSSNGGGGGAGGTFMSKGGNGGDGDNGDNNASGGNSPNALNVDPTILRGGCRGQTGGTGPGAAGGGGGAGGAVYVVGNTITLGVAGGIDVSGSNGLGGATDAGGGGGGGAGGMIFLDAITTLTINAGSFLMANGGGAGQGADNNDNGDPGADPSSPSLVALGGTKPSAGGFGGNGLFTAAASASPTAATQGTDGGTDQGAGGGGGGGGFIRSTKALTGASVSAGKIVSP